MGKNTLLVIFLLLLSFSTNAQITLDVVLDSIIKKGNERGVDMRTLIKKNVNYIHIVNELPKSKWNTKVLGKAVPGKNGRYDIYVIKEMFDDFYNAERVVIHEIGHALGLKHCCVDSYCVNIMAAQQAINPEHLLYQIAYTTSEYERTFDVFFNEIKQKKLSPRKIQRIMERR